MVEFTPASVLFQKEWALYLRMLEQLQSRAYRQFVVSFWTFGLHMM